MLERIIAAFGDVSIERELGSGAYGNVFAGTYKEKKIALKILNLDRLTGEVHDPGKTTDLEVVRKREGQITKFILEFGYLARVNSPNVVKVYEAGVREGMYYLIMEDGGMPLSKYSEKPLPAQDLLNIYSQIVHGLDDLHEVGLVHRDIKPDNILIDAKGRVTLTDLGLVGRLEETELRKGTFFGTLNYAAPEQFFGTHTKSTDVYSLGVVMYELAVGKLPYSTIKIDELLIEKRKFPPKVKTTRPDVPLELRHLIQRSLFPDPELRPATRMLRYDLLAIQEQQPLSEMTMLNDDLLDENLPFPEEKLRRWKELDIIVPTEIATEEDYIFLNPQKGREDYLLDIANKGTKKRLNGKITFTEANRLGYVAFTISSEDYAYDKRDRRFGDVFIIEKKDENVYKLEYRKHGGTKIKGEFINERGSGLEFVIERFSNDVMFGCNEHVLTQSNTYTSPTTKQEIWVSATTPVLIERLRAFHEIPGRVQDPLYHLERSFAEGRFEIAEYLATNLLADLSVRDPLIPKVQLYIAKSVARQLFSKENVGELESALMVLETLRMDLERIKEEAPEEIAEDAEHEFLNILFFIQKDYWEAYARLMSLYQQKQQAGKDASGLIAQGMMFAHQAPQAYKPLFESLRRSPREWSNAPAEI
ncbi:MAG: serine/threonine-protein kinase [Nanoarchaeota archaeon]